jgi:multidrug efflux pump subunit AcrA (membrane-fusion protein)
MTTTQIRKHLSMRIFDVSTGILLLLCLAVGCSRNGNEETTRDEYPRPVEIGILVLSDPPTSALVSASVASWKTEQIGFEVNGRVKSVLEPKAEIEGRNFAVESTEPEASNDTGQQTELQTPLIDANPVAEIEIESYELQVAIAEAKRDRLIQDGTTAEDQLNGLNFQKEAAEAKKKFAQEELKRIETLRQANAASKSELERAQAELATEYGTVAELEAQIGAKKSQILSLKQEVLQAEQSLQDAKRNLENCTLYSSFRGQVAELFVVPGSYVTAGSPVATIQMMNPIKVELEVSAEETRKLRKRIAVPIRISPPAGGKPVFVPGFLYLIDPVADPRTRTFTVTFLVLNEKTSVWSTENQHLPATDRPRWADLPFIPGAKPGKNEQGETVGYVESGAIHKDEKGHFLWRITNMEKHQPLPDRNRLAVTKMYVGLEGVELPFLGNWLFQQVIIPAEENFDPAVNVVAGILTFSPENPENWDADTWDGNEILVDRESKWGGAWMLRPGDVVKVDLNSTDAEQGYYVPMDAIAREAGKTYLYVVEKSNTSGAPKNDATERVVRRIEVAMDKETDDATSSLRRIRPVGESSFEGSLRYVTSGVHYLRNGERVRVAEAAGAAK